MGLLDDRVGVGYTHNIYTYILALTMRIVDRSIYLFCFQPYTIHGNAHAHRPASGTRPAWWSPSAWRWTRPCRYGTGAGWISCFCFHVRTSATCIHTYIGVVVTILFLSRACATHTCNMDSQPHQNQQPQFLFVATTPENAQASDEARISHPRVAVIARKRSAAKFVQSYVDVGALLCIYRCIYVYVYINQYTHSTPSRSDRVSDDRLTQPHTRLTHPILPHYHRHGRCPRQRGHLREVRAPRRGAASARQRAGRPGPAV